MKNCNNCVFRSVRKTKYGIYDWCKKNGCSVWFPVNPCKEQASDESAIEVSDDD